MPRLTTRSPDSASSQTRSQHHRQRRQQKVADRRRSGRQTSQANKQSDRPLRLHPAPRPAVRRTSSSAARSAWRGRGRQQAPGVRSFAPSQHPVHQHQIERGRRQSPAAPRSAPPRTSHRRRRRRRASRSCSRSPRGRRSARRRPAAQRRTPAPCGCRQEISGSALGTTTSHKVRGAARPQAARRPDQHLLGAARAVERGKRDRQHAADEDQHDLRGVPKPSHSTMTGISADFGIG